MKRTIKLLTTLLVMQFCLTGYSQTPIPAYEAFRTVFGFPNNGLGGDEVDQSAVNDFATVDAVASFSSGSYIVVGDFHVDWFAPNQSLRGNPEEHVLKILEISSTGTIANENTYYVQNINGPYPNGNYYQRVVRATRYSVGQDEDYYYILYNFMEGGNAERVRMGVLCLDPGLNKVWDQRFAMDTVNGTYVLDSVHRLRGVQIIPLANKSGVAVLSELEVESGPVAGKYYAITECAPDGSSFSTRVLDPQNYDPVFFGEWTPDFVEYSWDEYIDDVVGIQTQEGYVVTGTTIYGGKKAPIMMRYNATNSSTVTKFVDVPPFEYQNVSSLLRVNRTIPENGMDYELDNFYIAGQGRHLPSPGPMPRGYIMELPGDMFATAGPVQPKYHAYDDVDNSGFYDISTTILGCNQMGVVAYGYERGTQGGQGYTRAMIGMTQNRPSFNTTYSLLDQFASLRYGNTDFDFYGFHMADYEEDFSQILVGRTGDHEIQVEKTGIDQQSVLWDYSLYPDQNNCDEDTITNYDAVDDGSYIDRSTLVHGAAEYEFDPGNPLMDIPFEVVWDCSVNYAAQDCLLPPGSGYSWEINSVSAKRDEANGSIDDLNALDVHPNPTHGFLELTSKDGLDQITIVGTDGRTVLYNQFLEGQKSCQLDISRLPPGLYLIMAKSAGRVVTEKIVKH